MVTHLLSLACAQSTCHPVPSLFSVMENNISMSTAFFLVLQGALGDVPSAVNRCLPSLGSFLPLTSANACGTEQAPRASQLLTGQQRAFPDSISTEVTLPILFGDRGHAFFFFSPSISEEHYKMN